MRIKNTRFKPINILIILIYAISVTVCIAVMCCSYNEPSELKTATGSVTKMERHETEWYDYIFGTIGSHFKVTFADDSFYEAPGINYKNIDGTLFSNLSVGDELTVIYHDRWSGTNRIYGIEYNGKSYMNTEAVFAQMKNEKKTTLIIGSVFLGALTTVACVLIVVNYKKNTYAPIGVQDTNH